MDEPMKQTLPPFPAGGTVRCPKCSSTLTSPLLLSESTLATGMPRAFIWRRWPSNKNDPMNLIDWPEEWLGWTCRCGYVWETQCADAAGSST